VAEKGKGIHVRRYSMFKGLMMGEARRRKGMQRNPTWLA
jgi:hypothetical protein